MELYMTCAQTSSYNDPNRPWRTLPSSPTINPPSLEAQDPLSSLGLGTIQNKNPHQLRHMMCQFSEY